ncbi:MAG: hypothetical protein ACP5UF_04925 [Hydrogenobaculum sp.]
MSILVGVGLSRAEQVYVKPGKFSYFDAYIPTYITAGQKATFTLRQMDTYENFIKDFSYYDKKLLLRSTGDLSVDPELFSSKDFTDGFFNITIEDSKAGTATLSIFEGYYPVLIKNEATDSMMPVVSIKVVNGPVYKFAIEAPSIVEAGRDFVAKIIALDKYGNIVKNYASIGSDVVVEFKTSNGTLPYTIHAYKFKNGIADIVLRYDIPSKVAIDAYEVNNRKISSQDHYVDLYSPKPSRIKHPIARTVKPLYFGNEALGRLIVKNDKDTVVIVLVPEKEDIYVKDIKRHNNSMDITIERARP